MSDDDEMLSARVPQELKDLVNADKRDNQEIVRSALWREFGGKRMGDLERRIEEKERRVKMLERERDNREEELSKEQQELEALQAKYNKEESQQEVLLEEAMQVLETVPWEVDNPAIQTHAEELDMSPEDLINQLEDYHA